MKRLTGYLIDLAATTWTGITNIAYQNFLKFKGYEKEKPEWADVI